MKTPTMRTRALAIAAGAACTIGGLTILLDKTLGRPLEWTSYQWLTILMVFGTIAAGHLMADAGRARHLFAALGFLLLFLSGTGLVVYQSVGRQVESVTVSALSAEDANNRLVAKHQALSEARERLAYAERQMEAEQTGQKCRERCKRWEQTARDRRIVVQSIDAEIAAIGPQKPVNAQAEAMADIVLLFGVPASKSQIVAALLLLVPFGKTLFFEIGAIVSLGFAFSHRPAVIGAEQSDFPALTDEQFAGAKAALIGPQPNGSANVVAFPMPDGSPNGSGPRGPKPGKRNRTVKEAALADLTGRLDRGARFGSQDELAGRYGVAKSTMSDWLGEWERGGLIPMRRTEGRRKAVAAA